MTKQANISRQLKSLEIITTMSLFVTKKHKQMKIIEAEIYHFNHCI